MDNMIKLIPITTNADGEPIVSGREVRKFLKVKTRYNDWIASMLSYGFVENSDFVLVTEKKVTNNPKNPFTEITDHAMTLDMAKEICMLQRNERGKQARQYFIKIDKLYKQGNLNLSPVKMLTYLDAPCTTTKEIMNVYRCSDRTILVNINGLRVGEEYDYLMGADLRLFKGENKLNDYISSIFIFYPKGLRKIERYLKNQGLKPIENPKEVLLIK